MSIQLTESKATINPEVTISNRNAFLSLAVLIFLVLIYGTLISLLIHSASDIQKNMVNSLLSILLNLTSAVLFTHLFLYFSIYTTKISRVHGRIRIRSFGVLQGFSITDVLQEEIEQIIFVKTENPYTANYTVTLTLLLKGSKRKSNTFSLPRHAIDDSLRILERVIGVQKEEALTASST